MTVTMRLYSLAAQAEKRDACALIAALEAEIAKARLALVPLDFDALASLGTDGASAARGAKLDEQFDDIISTPSLW